jgi:hypothetical protein
LIDEWAISIHSVGNESAKQVRDEIAVTARDSVELIKFKKHPVGLFDFGTFGECLRTLHCQLEFLGEWFHRLHASDIGARNDLADNEIPNNARKSVSLGFAAF